MSRPIIQVRNFTKRYGDFEAVKDISFDVTEGSIFAFLGPNGAGKSTTINTLCTIFEKTEGTLAIDGRDVSREKNAVRRAIGVVFQESTLDRKMTVEENLRMHCALYSVPKGEVDERIKFVLELVDLADWRRKPAAALSGGMARRVEIARGLIHYPKVLFLDEPTSGVDPVTRREFWTYINEAALRGVTVMVTTHFMDEAEYCDRVALVYKGKVAAAGTPDELKAGVANSARPDPTLEDAFIRLIEQADSL